MRTTRYLPGTRIIDITNETFGRLKVVEFAGVNKNRKAKWLCVCTGPDCGNRKLIVLGTTLRDGRTQSCGCWQSEQSAVYHRTHGQSDHLLYRTWCNMIDRCTNPNHESYPWYGGRLGGPITVCNRWTEPGGQGFRNFIADMGERPNGTTLDRRDNARGYSKSNCRWATDAEQSRNTSRNQWIECWGIRMIRVDWANALGLNRETLRRRIKDGWPVERALSEGVDPTRLDAVIARHADGADVA